MKRRILIVEDNVGLSQMQKDWVCTGRLRCGNGHKRTDSTLIDT